MRRAALPIAAALLLAGCGADEPPAPAPSRAGATLAAAPLPPQVADFAALASKDCSAVVAFYLEALGGREWAQAALVWDDPVVDGARLEAVFGGYKQPQVADTEPSIEGAAGSAYCTVSGTLRDAQDAAKPPVEGTLVLKRVNDIPGASADQLRWTLRSSTFVEPLERSGGGEP